ncbi:cache domain-containing sensor histidine kinase [Peribacillus simplex]|uniref:histidine kinase n=1 Tax=Peribacillus simplex NBRC 15720 = DSM 1321 TaxID=1349754 RepID=A0A223EC86_9BACI|nr:sensor histidine kinase [Peribacillus simplex]ASS92801.1 sensor histidine kinase [Peribacillus simplex NBRC 15720 = DSM 1321]MEC1398171.1 sensor histidine kinase [Peribacillus simplex]
MIFKGKKRIQIKNLRLTTKLVTTYTLLTVLPMAFLGFIAYWQYTKSIEEEVGEYIPRLVKQVNGNIEIEIQKLETLPDLIYNSGDVMTILRDSQSKKKSVLLHEEYIMKSYLTRTYLNNNSSHILGAFLVSKNRIFASTSLHYDSFGFEDGSLPYADDLGLLGGMQLLLPNQTNLTFEGNPSYFMLVKPITDFDNRKNLGTLYIAIDVAFFEQSLQDLQKEKNVTMWIMNKQGKIIYHKDHSKIGTVEKGIHDYPLLNGSFRTEIDGKRNLISISESNELPWVLVHSMPIKNMTEKTDVIRSVTIFFFILFTLITTLISIFFAWTVTRPLNELGDIMKRVEKGDLLVDIPIHSKDEVGMLANSFRSMLAEIRELIQKNYHIELRKKTAELYALQSQINPHFMYNTLETIGMAVEEGESEEVVKMVTLLGRMMRFSISNKESLVPINSEVQHIEDYLNIQQFRFEDRLLFMIEKGTDTVNYYIPKFVLQPIVENSIKYGLEKRKEIDIQIHISEEETQTGEEDLLLIVSDNGPGITENKLIELNEKLRLDPMMKRDSGFGIINVNARIGMMFGEQYNLQINSEYGKGTTVVIRLPKINAQQVSMYVQGEEKNRDDTKGQDGHCR